MKSKLLEIAYLRNRLLSRRFSDEDADLLRKIEDKIVNAGGIFKEVALNAIHNCKCDIENEDYDSASEELQLIHNFAFENPNEWDSNYFFQIELLSYLENSTKVNRIKKTISLLGKLANFN